MWKFKLAFCAIVIGILVSVTIPYTTHGTKKVMVTGTVVKQTEEGGSKYLVFTDDGVFENTDSLYYFKYNSSDVQGQLMQGGKFEVTYYGYRVPFMSMYPNITSATRTN
jgi:hypothetical protein